MNFLICLSNSGKINETQIKVVICLWSKGEVQFEKVVDTVGARGRGTEWEWIFTVSYNLNYGSVLPSKNWPFKIKF